MSEIHLIHGFIGFGKTTLAKKLEKSLPAIRFTHDEIMLSKYGRNPNDFEIKYNLVDDFIRQQTIKAIAQKQNVILDYGFWNKKSRKEIFAWSKKLTNDVFFHTIICDIEIAKLRTIKRTQNNKNELFIDENCFNERLKLFEPLTNDEPYPIIFHDYSS